MCELLIQVLQDGPGGPANLIEHCTVNVIAMCHLSSLAMQWLPVSHCVIVVGEGVGRILWCLIECQ